MEFKKLTNLIVDTKKSLNEQKYIPSYLLTDKNIEFKAFKNDMLPIYYDATVLDIHGEKHLISFAFVSDTGSVFYYESDKINSDTKIPLKHPIIKDHFETRVMDSLKYKMLSHHECREMGEKFYTVKLKCGFDKMVKEFHEWIRNELKNSEYKKCQVYVNGFGYSTSYILMKILKGDLEDKLPDYVFQFFVDIYSALQSKGLDPTINWNTFTQSKYEMSLNTIDTAKLLKKCFHRLNMGVDL